MHELAAAVVENFKRPHGLAVAWYYLARRTDSLRAEGGFTEVGAVAFD